MLLVEANVLGTSGRVSSGIYKAGIGLWELSQIEGWPKIGTLKIGFKLAPKGTLKIGFNFATRN
jgi:hypothetical protein